MNREKFPEKVPFRLTRMMTKAMEVSGIEGNFRQAMITLASCCCFLGNLLFFNIWVCQWLLRHITTDIARMHSKHKKRSEQREFCVLLKCIDPAHPQTYTLKGIPEMRS